jgi:hypothetical protein
LDLLTELCISKSKRTELFVLIIFRAKSSRPLFSSLSPVRLKDGQYALQFYVAVETALFRV